VPARGHNQQARMNSTPTEPPYDAPDLSPLEFLLAV